ncbi:MAG: potassium-transporting ATPase subunit C, partial [Chloroflexi bacterium]|nr:potassium-transporting ATPase subunit C [Chloroflexota bacterium]
PTNQKLIDTVQQRADAYRAENGLAPDASAPVDAVTASASGLDPDITPANALLQVHRVATARGLSDDQVRNMLNQYTASRPRHRCGYWLPRDARPSADGGARRRPGDCPAQADLLQGRHR